MIFLINKKEKKNTVLILIKIKVILKNTFIRFSFHCLLSFSGAIRLNYFILYKIIALNSDQINAIILRKA